jgi:hypothetical protein
MALYPKAKLRLLPENETQPKITPRVAILHSVAGRGSPYNLFKNGSSLESTFWVSETGLVEQYMDTTTRADANRNANGFAVSIETESSPGATEPWTPAQLKAIIELVDWVCRVHGIPRVQCPKWDGAGIGWHIMFGSPGPWTPVAKSCPGPRRIEQTKSTVIPAVAKLGTAAKPDVASDGTIRPGDKGDHVKFLQALLNMILPIVAETQKKPLGNGQKLAENGIYDSSTTARVKEFEIFVNTWAPRLAALAGKPAPKPLQQDGIATLATQAALGEWVKAATQK